MSANWIDNLEFFMTTDAGRTAAQKAVEERNELRARLDAACDEWRQMMSDAAPEAHKEAAKWRLLAALEGRGVERREVNSLTPEQEAKVAEIREEASARRRSLVGD